MPAIKKKQVETAVNYAMQIIADFNDLPPSTEFAHFHVFHKKVFLSELRANILKTPWNSDYSGGTSKAKYYDVALDVNLFVQWINVNGCINYIIANHTENIR